MRSGDWFACSVVALTSTAFNGLVIWIADSTGAGYALLLSFCMILTACVLMVLTAPERSGTDGGERE